MAETKKKLPKSEWDFSGLEPSLVSYAFFYEYSRQSDKVKELVEGYRGLHPYIEHISVSDWTIPNEKAAHLSSDEKIKLYERAAPFKGREYIPLIRWLSYCEAFPNTPFMELDSTDYLFQKEMPRFSRYFPVDGRGFLDLESDWAREYRGKTNYIEDGREIFEIMAETDPENDHITIHHIFVDWWKSDSELRADFNRWIKFHRRNYKVKPVKALSRGLFDRPLDLPKECRKKNTALIHLGKLRCLEASGSWEKYLTLYHTAKSDRRYLEKDVSAARKVIAWLEDKV